MSVAALIYPSLAPFLTPPFPCHGTTGVNSADFTIIAARERPCNPDVARDTICRGDVQHLLVLFYI